MQRAILAVAALLAAGAASFPARAVEKSDTRALYEAHAGAPVDRFRLFGSPTRWTALDDASLVVWTRPSEAWLLDLSGPCTDLQYASAIALTDTLGSVRVQFDKVLVSSRSLVKLPCQITRIRPVDTRAVKAARAAARAARQASGT